MLAAAHAQGIVHRDVKPDNLFVLHDGRLKVLDFGIARVREGAPLKRRTRAGEALGTAPYMPPEQIRGTEIDARADLFAVGATMFRLIAGRHVHEAENEAEMLLKMVNEPAPPLLSVAPHAPRGVGLVVDRALMLDRERRYPDAATMQGDVRALREGRPPPFASVPAKEGTAASAPEKETVRDPRFPSRAPAQGVTAVATPAAMARPAPSAERTLRSEQAVGGAGAAVAPQGYVMATTEVAAVHLPAEAGQAVSRSPRTLLEGLAPVARSPGESIPVLPAPTRRSTLPGTEIAVLPLVLVGVVFAALGVGLTLWLMLSNTETATPPAATGTPAVQLTSPHEIGPSHGLPTSPAKPSAVKNLHKAPGK